MLVTLHGDWGVAAPELHAAWERFAATRDVALLSLTCPVDRGCKRSWWEWNGDPSWITEQVERLAARQPIDRERMWLAGWSGGSAYMGMHTQEIERTFAALVLHGGGTWPLRAGCAAEKSAVVFLAGDQNPLHPRVLKLRDHYEACGNDLTFTLLRGADHDAEWRALEKRGGPILDLLATKRRVTAAVAPAPSVVSSADPSLVGFNQANQGRAAETNHGRAAETNHGRAGAVGPVPRAGCGCEMAGGDACPPWLAIAAVVVLGCWRQRAQRCHSSS